MSGKPNKSSLISEEFRKETEKVKKETAVLEAAKQKAMTACCANEQELKLSLTSTSSSEDCKDVHEFQARIERLETQCKLAEERARRAEEERRALKEEVEGAKGKLEERGLHLARAEVLYREQLNKTVHYKQQIDKLTASLRATSTKYKNAVTAYRARHSFQETALTHEREAMGKLIRHYEHQLYPEEAPEEELEVRRLVELSEGQQADIEALLGKLVEREEYYRNATAANEELLKREREEAQFSEDLCSKIELSLAAWKNAEASIIDRCVEVNAENACLRERIKEVTAELARTQTAQSSIKRYEQELQMLIQEFQRRTCAEIDQQAIANELASERERSRQQEEKIASQTERIEALTRQNEDSEEMNADLLSQLERSQSKNKALVMELERTKEQYQSELDALSQSQVQSLSLLRSEVIKIESCKPPPVLAHSDILDGMNEQLKQNLIALLQATRPQRSISRTKLLFREDKYHRNFGNYLTTPGLPLLLLLRVDQQQLIGGFACLSTSTSTAEGHEGDGAAFLFTCSDGQAVRCFRKAEKEFKRLRALTFAENCLFFGNNELVVRNNAADQQAVLNTNIFGAAYYEKVDKAAFIDGDTSRLPYQQLEIHSVEFA